MGDEETPLQMARRHVAEAEQRLVRQERLVSELEIDGHLEMVPSARALLERMGQFLQMCRAHLDYETAKQEGTTDQASLQRLLNLMSAMEIVPNSREPKSN